MTAVGCGFSIVLGWVKSLEDEREIKGEFDFPSGLNPISNILTESSSTLLFSCDHLKLLTTGTLNWDRRGGGEGGGWLSNAT